MAGAGSRRSGELGRSAAAMSGVAESRMWVRFEADPIGARKEEPDPGSLVELSRDHARDRLEKEHNARAARGRDAVGTRRVAYALTGAKRKSAGRDLEQFRVRQGMVSGSRSRPAQRPAGQHHRQSLASPRANERTEHRQ